MQPGNNVLEIFLCDNGLNLVSRIAKGWTSEVFLAEGRLGEKVVLKVLAENSNRRDMARRESENLSIANSVGVGPKLISADLGLGVVMMEYINGPYFSKWLFSGSGPTRAHMQKFIDCLCSQARALDKVGLDHGQLAGRGRNILVRDGLPVIIDFEKASTQRKCHNLNVVEAFLFRSKNSVVVKMVNEIFSNNLLNRQMK